MRWLFQVFVEPLPRQIVKFFFVRVELPFLSQSQNSMEHAEFFSGALVDISDHKP